MSRSNLSLLIFYVLLDGYNVYTFYKKDQG